MLGHHSLSLDSDTFLAHTFQTPAMKTGRGKEPSGSSHLGLQTMTEEDGEELDNGAE